MEVTTIGDIKLTVSTSSKEHLRIRKRDFLCSVDSRTISCNGVVDLIGFREDDLRNIFFRYKLLIRLFRDDGGPLYTKEVRNEGRIPNTTQFIVSCDILWPYPERFDSIACAKMELVDRP